MYNNLDSGTKAVSAFRLREMGRQLINDCRQKWEEASKENKRAKKEGTKVQSKVKEVKRTGRTVVEAEEVG